MVLLKAIHRRKCLKSVRLRRSKKHILNMWQFMCKNHFLVVFLHIIIIIFLKIQSFNYWPSEIFWPSLSGLLWSTHNHPSGFNRGFIKQHSATNRAKKMLMGNHNWKLIVQGSNAGSMGWKPCLSTWVSITNRQWSGCSSATWLWSNSLSTFTHHQVRGNLICK